MKGNKFYVYVSGNSFNSSIHIKEYFEADPTVVSEYCPCTEEMMVPT